MIHHWLGWISFALCILLLSKYMGRTSKNKNINTLLRKIHKPIGFAVIGIGTIHGVICLFKNQRAIIQNISGLILFALVIALAGTFYARTKLKAKWIQLHRNLAIFFCIVIVIHIVLSVS
ncbi:hypothetical protein D3Z36_08110 [Lachnospiraceae bacterium]|nr:hypothetical protein [Lachnospiraceae bacterium]